MTHTHQVLGTTDIDTCECCGRTGLKQTIAMALIDADGNHLQTVHYGTTCAAKATKWTVKEVKQKQSDADKAAREMQEAENRRKEEEKDAAWSEWLTAQTGMDGVKDRLNAIRALGGFIAAQTAFSASYNAQ